MGQSCCHRGVTCCPLHCCPLPVSRAYALRHEALLNTSRHILYSELKVRTVRRAVSAHVWYVHSPGRSGQVWASLCKGPRTVQPAGRGGLHDLNSEVPVRHRTAQRAIQCPIPEHPCASCNEVRAQPLCRHCGVARVTHKVAVSGLHVTVHPCQGACASRCTSAVTPHTPPITTSC